eukprot:37280-Pelagomonas_calceolata.AAC.2
MLASNALLNGQCQRLNLTRPKVLCSRQAVPHRRATRLRATAGEDGEQEQPKLRGQFAGVLLGVCGFWCALQYLDLWMQAGQTF